MDQIKIGKLIASCRKEQGIYDISQPVFSCNIFPGDPEPKQKKLQKIEDGDSYNLTEFSMCTHNGTHVDAPSHFIKSGKGIGDISLGKFIGKAYVVSHEGEVTASDAAEFLRKAAMASEGAEKRILIKGKALLSLDAAKVFASAGIELIGNESQTFGPEDAPMEVHLALLTAEVVLLEGIRLQHVPDGVYLLNCAPLNLGKSDGAPCRATLMELEL